MEHGKNKRQGPSSRERRFAYDLALVGAVMIALIVGWPLITLWDWLTGS
jgi:hypothetical protein